MKRYVFSILVLFVILFTLGASAETDFERAVSDQGAIKKEYSEYALINSENGDISVQMAMATELFTGEKHYAIRFVIYDKENHKSIQKTGIIDHDEIPQIISTLEYIKENEHKLTNNTEVVYTSKNGLQIGAVVTDTDIKLYISFIPADQYYISTDDMEYIIEILNGSKDFVEEETT